MTITSPANSSGCFADVEPASDCPATVSLECVCWKSGQHLLLCLLCLLIETGCSVNRFLSKSSVEPVISPEISQEQLVQHLNRNILGTDNMPGVAGWKTSDARIQVTGIPVPLPASLAVEAPRNLRIRVSNPISGGQEVDIGSNHERFWMWTKEQPELITCRHEDVELAFQHLELPVHIQPEWLMEVFGVVPIESREYRLQRGSSTEPVLDLVAQRLSPAGESVERIIRVNTVSGQIQEHTLRKADGEVIARARLDKYTEMPNGTTLPLLVRISWPEAKTEMKISLGRPEVNPPSFATASAMWEMPNIPGSKVVDIGNIGRRMSGPGQVRTVASETGSHNNRTSPESVSDPFADPSEAGQVALAPTSRLEAPRPVGMPGSDAVSQPVGSHRPASGRERDTIHPFATPAPAAFPGAAEPPSASTLEFAPSPATDPFGQNNSRLGAEADDLPAWAR